MPNKKKHSHAPKKRIHDVVPREYNTIGSTPDFVSFNPSEHRPVFSGFVNKAEKWVIMILLALAAAAFLGFKFLQNSELSFNFLGETQEEVVGKAVNNQDEFKQVFMENRRNARNLMADKKAGRSTKANALSKVVAKPIKKYSKGNGQKRYAKKTHSKNKRLAKATKRKVVARR